MVKNRLSVLLFAAIFMAIMVFSLSSCSKAPEVDADPSGLGLETFQGYTAVIPEGESEQGSSFLVCGTQGRLDRIFADGTLENIPLPVGEKNLTSILKGDGIILVGGESALVYSQDGKEFVAAKGAGKEYILGMTQFKGSYYACTYGGNILSSEDGMSWAVAEKLTDKPLIGIAAEDEYIMAITNDTDIFKSTEGTDWALQNYNELYKGVAEPLSFIDLLNPENSFIVLGQSEEAPDKPVVMFSYDAGETWRDSSLVQINKQPSEEFYPIVIHSVRLFEGEMIAACDGGRILTFSDCPTCSIISEAAGGADLRCIEVYGDALLVAGSDFQYEILKTSEVQTE